MVALLGEEQGADDAKKEQCEKDIDETEDKHKELNVQIADLEKATAETKESIATLGDEIAALTQGIKDLDKQVAEATEAPGGIAGTGVTVLAQGAPPPPPETFGAYSK